ncbi:MAG: SWIM zinc finger family protein [Ilumatobacteraceae bacterium]
MTTVIHPTLPGEPDPADAHPAGRLATTLLSVAVASATESSRYRRGRLLLLEGAVLHAELDTGLLRATVQGSAPAPYEVVVSVPTVARPTLGDAASLRTHLGALTPTVHEVTSSCSCLDLERPCKHIAAALLCLAEHLTARPELLLEWRCHSGEVSSVAAGSRALRTRLDDVRRGGTVPRTAPPTVPHGADWDEFVGTAPPVAPPVPDEAAAVGTPMFGAIDLGAWLRSALDHLAERS